MQERFIYAFDDDSRDRLLALGLNIMMRDDRQSVYIFLADDTDIEKFDLKDIKYVTSNTLTF